MAEPTRQPHSAECFGEERDFWWNRDYLELIAARVAFPEARSLLDVGCGKCHWTAIAAGLFPGLEEIVGVDFEVDWVEGAKASLLAHLAGQGAAQRDLALSFVRADAHALPLGDATFDVVTCQTVLMHLARPEDAVAEMFRVVKPGGLVLLAEPETSLNFVRVDSAADALSLEELTRRYHFWTAVHRARLATGIDWAIGNRLLGLLEAQGGVDARVYVNDRAVAMAPPYARPDQRAAIAAEDAWIALLTSDSPTRRGIVELALAGGVTEAEVEDAVAIEAKLHAARRAQIAAGTWRHGGGSLHYVAWARRSDDR